MESFLSCFSCQTKQSDIVKPKSNSITPISNFTTPIKVNVSQKEQTSQNMTQQIQEEKSRCTTALTFRTAETAPSKNESDESYIDKKIQITKNLAISERKAMESQFIRQNLSKTTNIYLIEKDWSQEYTRFLKDTKSTTIRPVNNWKITDQSGSLLPNIRERDHYYTISERIWKYIIGLYGGGPQIKRDIYFPAYVIFAKKIQIPFQGFQNPLNLCFMISIIQCLLSIQQFPYYLNRRMYLDNSEVKKKVYHTIFHKLIRQLVDSKEVNQSIKQFASHFESKFNPYEQHDAQQFLLYIMDELREQMKLQTRKPSKQLKNPEQAYFIYWQNNTSIMDKIFAGQNQSTVSCLRCEKKSTVYLPFLEICLEIVDNTLEGCLRKHFSQEKLDDLYDCEICNKKCKATKQTFITKTPNYLLIALKKFTSSGRKNQDRVKYNHELDISKYCIKHHGETKYNLISIVIHKGTKINKGHYYCYTRRNKSDWYYCNDEVVKKVESTDILGRDAYLLFYQRIR